MRNKKDNTEYSYADVSSSSSTSSSSQYYLDDLCVYFPRWGSEQRIAMSRSLGKDTTIMITLRFRLLLRRLLRLLLLLRLSIINQCVHFSC